MPDSNKQLAFKAAVKTAFLAVLQQRIFTAQSAMEEAQSSANRQEKSSAGDKYETSRAMGQIDRDMNATQLQQAKEEYSILENIPVTMQEQVVPGAIIRLNTGFFFAAIGLGQLVVETRQIFAISCQSPLFAQLKMKRKGDVILFRDQKLQVLEVF